MEETAIRSSSRLELNIHINWCYQFLKTMISGLPLAFLMNFHIFFVIFSNCCQFATFRNN